MLMVLFVIASDCDAWQSGRQRRFRCEAARLIIGRPRARAARISAGSKDPKDDQEL